MDDNIRVVILNQFMSIGIPYLLMNLLLCHGFMKNKNSTVILLCPSWMEYHFSQGFVMLEQNTKT